MRKILTSVEILENKSTLRFSYDDNSQKDYLINVDTQRRTIKIDNDSKLSTIKRNIFLKYCGIKTSPITKY
jgi:hypothetical protein